MNVSQKINISQKIHIMRENIKNFNNYNKELNTTNTIENYIYIDNKVPKKVIVEKKEKDLMKAIKLLKAKYDVKQNKYANFNLDNEDNNIVLMKDLNIEDSEIIYTWNKLPEDMKEKLVEQVVEIERKRYNLKDNICNDLKELLLNNGKNIIYDKYKKIILGAKNLIYKVGYNNTKEYKFIDNKSQLTSKLNKHKYMFI